MITTDQIAFLSHQIESLVTDLKHNEEMADICRNNIYSYTDREKTDSVNQSFVYDTEADICRRRIQTLAEELLQVLEMAEVQV